MEEIGKRLKKLRMQRGLSLKQFADLVAIPVSTYKEWEYGRAIQGEPYEKLAHGLGVSLTEVLTGRPPETRITSLLAELNKIKDSIESLEKELLSLDAHKGAHKQDKLLW